MIGGSGSRQKAEELKATEFLGERMMAIRRAMAMVVALVVSATFAASGVAAQQAQAKQDTKKRSKQEQQEIETVVKLVDGVMAGQPAPSDITMTLEPFFMKSQEQRTFVPFVLTVTNAPKTDAALYVRVVNPAAVPDPKAKKVEYPWDDIHFVPAAALAGDSVKLNRVFMATAGTYDVYIAFKERLPEKAPKNAVPKMGVLKTQVTVPDYYNGELATSTILVADKVNMLTAAPSPDEARERPFVFGMQELLPAPDMEFKKAEELSIFFQVYNSGLDATGKPNLSPRIRVPQGRRHRREVLQQDQPADGQRHEPAAAVRPGQVPGPWRNHGPAGLFRRGQLPPQRQDHGQGKQQQGPVPGHQVHGQGIRAGTSRTVAVRQRPVTGVD